MNAFHNTVALLLKFAGTVTGNHVQNKTILSKQLLVLWYRELLFYFFILHKNKKNILPFGRETKFEIKFTRGVVVYMVKRLLLLLFLPVLVLSVGFVPKIVLANTQKVPYVFPSVESFAETIEVNGEIIEGQKREIYISVPVYAEKVTISVGDMVQQGQVVAIINQEVTKAVAASSVTVPKISSEVSGDAIAALAEQYGIPVDFAAQYVPKETAPASAAKGDVEQIPREIIAPITGVVTQSSLQENVMTSMENPLITISSIEHFKAKMEVPEEKIQQVKIGDSVIVSSSSFSAACRGKISKIYPTAQTNPFAASKTVTVEADIQTGVSQLKPGFSVNGSIYVGENEELLTIPYEAVGQDSNQQEYVYVYSKGRPVRKNITTGKELLHTVEVTKGLGITDIVLLEPENIQPNLMVRLKGEYHVS